MTEPIKNLHQPASLKAWEEITGEVRSVQVDESQIELFMEINGSSRRLKYDTESPEAQIIKDNLDGKSGTLVSILRVDSTKKPIQIQERGSK